MLFNFKALPQVNNQIDHTIKISQMGEGVCPLTGEKIEAVEIAVYYARHPKAISGSVEKEDTSWFRLENFVPGREGKSDIQWISLIF